jgi:hypothetical protein
MGSPRGCTLPAKGAAAKRAPIARARRHRRAGERLDDGGRGHRGIPNQRRCSLPVEPNRSAGNTAAASASSDG